MCQKARGFAAPSRVQRRDERERRVTYVVPYGRALYPRALCGVSVYVRLSYRLVWACNLRAPAHTCIYEFSPKAVCTPIYAGAVRRARPARRPPGPFTDFRAAFQERVELQP